MKKNSILGVKKKHKKMVKTGVKSYSHSAAKKQKKNQTLNKFHGTT
jgi:hypothetical protein